MCCAVLCCAVLCCAVLSRVAWRVECFGHFFFVSVNMSHPLRWAPNLCPRCRFAPTAHSKAALNLPDFLVGTRHSLVIGMQASMFEELTVEQRRGSLLVQVGLCCTHLVGDRWWGMAADPPPPPPLPPVRHTQPPLDASVMHPVTCRASGDFVCFAVVCVLATVVLP